MNTYNNYIMFLSDLMAIEPPVVIYQKDGKAYYGNGQKTESFQLKPSAKATTIVKENKIYVDLDKFKDEIDLYLSLAHEVRHCAQYQAINDVGLADIATPEMLKVWKKELKEYKGSENEGYETQHIELDAFAFAWFIGISVFGVELHLNGVRSGKQLLSSYIQFISNNYSIEELRDCLEYSGFAYNRNQA